MLYTAFDGTQRSVRDGRLKLIVYPKIGYEQLFDLQRTRFELRNLSGTRHARRERLRARMEEEHAALGDPHPLSVEREVAEGVRLPVGGTEAGQAPAGVGDREVLRPPPARKP